MRPDSAGGVGALPGGGGGGALTGLVPEVERFWEYALRAAWAARDVEPLGALGGRLGGGGGVDLLGAAELGKGGALGGKGGALGGVGAAFGGGGARPDGFRPPGRGGFGFIPGGGGLGFDFVLISTMLYEAARRLPRNEATEGGACDPGSGGAAPGGSGGAPGGRGADGAGAVGALGALGRGRVDSGSDMYGELPPLSAPVSTPVPPVFRNLGMPPANMPANCGGALPVDASPPALLLRALFGVEGGARPGALGGGRFMPGIGGAPMTGAADVGLLSIMGEERSLMTPTFLRRAPDWMSPRRAPCMVS